MWWIAGPALLVLLLAAAAWGPVVSSRVEQPQYRVVAEAAPFEIRDYGPMIVAETAVTGPREVAINAGFRRIADYIFGNNTASAKVAMAAPVARQVGENIAMTAPVLQESDSGVWRVRFIMPAAYTLETLPKPNNPEVVLRPIEGRRFAVVRFSGRASADNLARHGAMLDNFIRERGLQSLSGPTYAFYNPPWTLPMLRRNEVLIEVTKSD